ncbi:hypothetical protein BCR41DRAFT_421369 [Lobosporangium transversale]|uniref:Sld7 C-terminal domain-containing protein n=1 Tax=Lobosporangium transversale TaxID=64571 RepID=A0A1Y2GQL2_9FUNG|nr:hypothetical protein BCR41DRAFT_421369 [Lobosporangium transversale]ORZ19186.1 hypothetical protein BCR41DRAFT_421369 [Lobosporangium transversale]|eukprot:XP_021882354.1 hypothetical protein BCR41DRAFT_421369 [Lobosporangium transversale]
MKRQDVPSRRLSQSSTTVLNGNIRSNDITDIQELGGSIPQGGNETIDEASVFSFRRKKLANGGTKVGPASFYEQSPFLMIDKKKPAFTPKSRRIQQQPSPPTSADVTPVTHPSSTLKQCYSPVSSSSLLEHKLISTTIEEIQSGRGKGRKSDEQEWDLIWGGSWIVPSLKPITSTSTSASIATSLSSSGRKEPGSLKKASLDKRQQTIFEGCSGVKLQPTVTELPGIGFAISKLHLQQLHEHQQGTIYSQPARENTEMHLIAKIQISSFPIFLLAPGCTEPCRIFTSPESTVSAQYLMELFDQDDIDDMRARCREGGGMAMGQIGLLLRVVKKPGQSSKKKGMLSAASKQDENPFLLSTGNAGTSSPANSTAEVYEDPRLKLYQETTMFLVYGILDGNSDNNHGYVSETNVPTISFFAYPLVDQVNLSEQIFLNSRSLERLKQDTEAAQFSSADVELFRDNIKLGASIGADAEAYIQYEDPIVNSIMNGSENDDDTNEEDSGHVSHWSAFLDMNVDEDKSLRQEIEMLRALERSKTWTPYIVPLPQADRTLSAQTISLSSATAKDNLKERALTRTQTLNRMAFANKDVSSDTGHTLSRHRSMDSHVVGCKQTISNGMDIADQTAATTTMTATIPASTASSTKVSRTVSATKVIRKGLSRVKSPSRAPQQPLDVTTESLRRRLLGPGSIRTGLPSASFIPLTTSTKSIEAHNKATIKGLLAPVLSRINITTDHEDYKECAANLYRSVTFAMRKDITSRQYHLDELERLMDRHAALL